MFYYYGRKKMLAGRYPSPEHETIIEPFAGSAAYSLHANHWEKRVILSDVSEMVIGIWKYLLQASPEDIKSLPDPGLGVDVRKEYKTLSNPELDLIGLHTGVGKPTRRSVVGKFSRWSAGKKYIFENIHKIKHWEVHQCSYDELKFSGEATWFVDPPYQHAGSVYKGHSMIDYNKLASWVDTRDGLVVVCGDYDRDTWVPLKILGETKSAGKKRSREGIMVRGKVSS